MLEVGGALRLRLEAVPRESVRRRDGDAARGKSGEKGGGMKIADWEMRIQKQGARSQNPGARIKKTEEALSGKSLKALKPFKSLRLVTGFGIRIG
jgi:hypothetical protein